MPDNSEKNANEVSSGGSNVATAAQLNEKAEKLSKKIEARTKRAKVRKGVGGVLTTVSKGMIASISIIEFVYHGVMLAATPFVEFIKDFALNKTQEERDRDLAENNTTWKKIKNGLGKHALGLVKGGVEIVLEGMGLGHIIATIDVARVFIFDKKAKEKIEVLAERTPEFVERAMEGVGKENAHVKRGTLAIALLVGLVAGVLKIYNSFRNKGIKKLRENLDKIREAAALAASAEEENRKEVDNSSRVAERNESVLLPTADEKAIPENGGVLPTVVDEDKQMASEHHSHAVESILKRVPHSSGDMGEEHNHHNLSDLIKQIETEHDRERSHSVGVRVEEHHHHHVSDVSSERSRSDGGIGGIGG